MSRTVAISALTKGDFLKAPDGVVVRARALADALSSRYDVHLIVRADGSIREDRMTAVGPAGTKLWNLKLVPVILRNRFGCVYCVGDRYGFLTYYLLSKLLGYRIVFEITDVWTDVIRRRETAKTGNLPWWQRWRGLNRTLDRLAVTRAHRVTAVAGYIRDAYLPYRPDVHLIPIFVNEDLFSERDLSRKTQVPRKRRIGIIGPFDIPRNMRCLRFIHDNLERFDDGVEVVVIGSCDERVDAEGIAYTGHLESVHDYAGQIQGLDAAIAVGKEWDPGPHVSVLECMSCGLPVFGTPEGVFGLEHLEAGHDVLIFPEDDLIDNINRLIKNDDLMERTGRNARATVERWYSRRANAERLVELVEGLDPA